MQINSKLPVKPITAAFFDDMVESARLIVADRIGPKVMRLDNGNIIKLFRRKRLLSSALFAPYAIRFSNNAFRLMELDIPTITPVTILHCKDRQTHIVEYQPLEGELLRGLLQASNSEELFTTTAKFIARLHINGVYFRSLHFENIVHHQGKLGLIDVADMKIYRHTLSRSLQQRNFQHFLRYPADAELINRFGLDRFESIYLQALRQQTVMPD